jgi:hypothetical protein
MSPLIGYYPCQRLRTSPLGPLATQNPEILIARDVQGFKIAERMITISTPGFPSQTSSIVWTFSLLMSRSGLLESSNHLFSAPFSNKSMHVHFSISCLKMDTPAYLTYLVGYAMPCKSRRCFFLGQMHRCCRLSLDSTLLSCSWLTALFGVEKGSWMLQVLLLERAHQASHLGSFVLPPILSPASHSVIVVLPFTTKNNSTRLLVHILFPHNHQPSLSLCLTQRPPAGWGRTTCLRLDLGRLSTLMVFQTRPYASSSRIPTKQFRIMHGS